MDFPVCDLFPDIVRSLKSSPNLVIQAPTGAGKSTGVPICLWRALPDLNLSGRVIVLEPRRLAARLVAERLAENLGETLGQKNGTVGLTTRTDKIGNDTVGIEVMTEGVLTRRLQNDPELSGVAVVIFDEFHERNVQSDMGLAFALDCQAGLRDDLRLVVMSATLDTDPVASLMGATPEQPAPILTSQGRMFDVEQRYLPINMPRGYHGGDLARGVAGAVKTIMDDVAGTDYHGDILVFLPGQGEIKQTEKLLLGNPLGDGVDIIPLYGQLPPDQQTRAVRPSPTGRQKIVLATAVAETSVTIQGITVVVDCGWQRTAQFNPRTGINELVTSRVTASSANQRAGRAGRLRSGVCYRLWAGAETRALRPHNPPEITVCDTMPLALDLAVWGVDSADKIPLLDTPNPKIMAGSQAVLHDLGVLHNGRLTDNGKQVAPMPLHPRLGRMVLACDAMGQGKLGIILASLLMEPDCLRFGNDGDFDGDIALRLQAYLGYSVAGATVNKGVLQRVKRTVQSLQRHVKTNGCDGGMAGVAIAHAYFDRMASSRDSTAINSTQKHTPKKNAKPTPKHQQSGLNFVCVSGQGVRLKSPVGALCGASHIAVAHMGSGVSGRGDDMVYLAGVLDKSDITTHFANHITNTAGAVWSGQESRVLCRKRQAIGHMVLSDQPHSTPDTNGVAMALLDGIRQTGLHVLPWDKDTTALRGRIQFAHTHIDGDIYPPMDDDTLFATLADWALPFVMAGMNDFKSLAEFDLKNALLSRLPYDVQQGLNETLPSHITMPTGTHALVDYGGDNAPAVSVRIQEVFGMTDTPKIGNKPVTMILLSPARRPIQVTQDLAGFWQSSYSAVRADMRGQYPKHYWPENPANATPTNKIKNKM